MGQPIPKQPVIRQALTMIQAFLRGASSGSTLFQRALAFGLAASMLCLASCQSGGTAQLTWTGGETEEIEYEARGVSLGSELELLTSRHERRDGKLYAQLELFNKRYGNLSFEWKLDWYDQNGFLYDSARGWIPEVIGGKETHTVGAIAPNTQAVSWRLSARRPNVVR